jgi:AcrR family transcriptional regulator
MRVTAEAQAKTRQKILQAAQKLFSADGFDATTTRDIAHAAGIASGTLFNYFATKEAILARLVADALEQIDFDPETFDTASFEEALFAHVAAVLRKFRPFRKHLTALLETSLGPMTAGGNDDSQVFRTSHLETVTQLARRFGVDELSAVALQLYWTLYTGALLFWAHDRSPRQEGTLALLDDSLSMFAGWLASRRDDLSATTDSIER